MGWCAGWLVPCWLVNMVLLIRLVARLVEYLLEIGCLVAPLGGRLVALIFCLVG